MTAARGPSRTDLLPFFRGRTRDAGFAVTARCASVVRTERVPASSIPPLFPRGDQEIGWGAVQRIRGRDCERVVGLEVTLPKLRAVKIGGNGKEYQAASAPAGAPHIPRSFFFFPVPLIRQLLEKDTMLWLSFWLVECAGSSGTIAS